MNTEDARKEIRLRLDRETQFILCLATLPDTAHDSRELVKAQLKKNDETIRLIGRYLESCGDGWETFYRENYWDKNSA